MLSLLLSRLESWFDQTLGLDRLTNKPNDQLNLGENLSDQH
jgi:hypothetical protein